MWIHKTIIFFVLFFLLNVEDNFSSPVSYHNSTAAISNDYESSNTEITGSNYSLNDSVLGVFVDDYFLGSRLQPDIVARKGKSDIKLYSVPANPVSRSLKRRSTELEGLSVRLVDEIPRIVYHLKEKCHDCLESYSKSDNEDDTFVWSRDGSVTTLTGHAYTSYKKEDDWRMIDDFSLDRLQEKVDLDLLQSRLTGEDIR